MKKDREFQISRFPNIRRLFKEQQIFFLINIRFFFKKQRNNNIFQKQSLMRKKERKIRNEGGQDIK